VSVHKYNADKNLGLTDDVLEKYDRFDVVEELVFFTNTDADKLKTFGKIFIKGINFQNKITFKNMPENNNKTVVFEDCTFKSLHLTTENVYWITLRGNVVTNSFKIKTETVLKLDSCKFTCPELKLVQLCHLYLENSDITCDEFVLNNETESHPMLTYVTMLSSILNCKSKINLSQARIINEIWSMLNAPALNLHNCCMHNDWKITVRSDFKVPVLSGKTISIQFEDGVAFEEFTLNDSVVIFNKTVNITDVLLNDCFIASDNDCELTCDNFTCDDVLFVDVHLAMINKQPVKNKIVINGKKVDIFKTNCTMNTDVDSITVNASETLYINENSRIGDDGHILV
jgi:hypothetical protein